MNKKILAIAILTTVAIVTPAFALPTQANAQSGGSIPPIVMAKAEWIKSGTIDDDTVKPWLQVNPSGTYGQSRTLGYLVVATDLDGYDDLNAAYADVYHPNGCFKYQVALPRVISCTENSAELETWISYLTNKDNKKLMTYGSGFDLNKTIAKLRQCSAKLFVGTADLDYCQMCGQFTWRQTCENCQNGWVVDNFDSGYKVEAYVYDRTGEESAHLTNFFEYICQAGIETDFTSLDFETVRYQVHKWIEGDRVFSDTKGPACLPVADGGTNTACVAPTYRNVGNMPLKELNITQDDMQFSYSGPSTNKDWNVRWDARIGDWNDNPVVEFDPYQKAEVVGKVDMCQLDKISFSIFVKKMSTTGTHTGTVLIEPVSVMPDLTTCNIHHVRYPLTGNAYVGYEDWPNGDFDYNDFGMNFEADEVYNQDWNLTEVTMTFNDVIYDSGADHYVHIKRPLVGNYTYTVTRFVPDYAGETPAGTYSGSGDLDVILYNTAKYTWPQKHINEPVTIKVVLDNPELNPKQVLTPPRSMVNNGNTIVDLDPFMANYDPWLHDYAGVIGTFHITDVEHVTSVTGAYPQVLDNRFVGMNLPHILVVPKTGWIPPYEDTSISRIQNGVGPYNGFYDYYWTGNPANWYETVTNNTVGLGGISWP